MKQKFVKSPELRAIALRYLRCLGVVGRERLGETRDEAVHQRVEANAAGDALNVTTGENERVHVRVWWSRKVVR